LVVGSGKIAGKNISVFKCDWIALTVLDNKLLEDNLSARVIQFG
jgi:hypothetical protein